MDEAAEHFALIVHAHTAAVAGHDTDAETLVSVDVATIHLAAVVKVDAAAPARGFVVAHDATVHLGTGGHVDAGTEGGMHSHGFHRAVGSIAVLDDATVEERGAAQGLGAVFVIQSVGGKPHDVVGVAREGGGIDFLLVGWIPLENGLRAGVVTGEDSLVLHLPRFGSTAFQGAVVGFERITDFISFISTVHTDAGIHLKRSEEHAATGLLRTFRWHILALGHIDASSFADTLLLHIVVQVVDGILQVVLGSGPAQSITGIGSCGGDITH